LIIDNGVERDVHPVLKIWGRNKKSNRSGRVRIWRKCAESGENKKKDKL